MPSAHVPSRARPAVALVLATSVLLGFACGTSSGSAHPPPEAAAALSSLGKIGIATFAVTERIRAGSVGPLVGLQPNEWGAAMLEASYPDFRRALDDSLGGILVEDDVVPAVAGYATLPIRKGEWATPPPMRPLRAADSDLPLLGQLAAAADVDAVALLSSELSVRTDKDSLDQFVCSKYVFRLVAPDGTLLFRKGGGAQSKHESNASALVGAATEESARRMGKSALERSLDDIDRFLRHQRDGAPLRRPSPKWTKTGMKIELMSSCG